MPNFNLVSDCCERMTVQSTKHEYPLGGTTWFQSFKVTTCTGCGQECEHVEACENCGEVGCMGVCEDDQAANG